MSRALIIVILILSPGCIKLIAQGNREARHAFYRVEDDRISNLELRPVEGPELSYMAKFPMEDLGDGSQIFARIPGQAAAYKLILNGFTCGSDPGGPLAAEFRVTPFLKEENLLILEFDTSGITDYEQCLFSSDEVGLIRRESIHIRDMLVSQYGGQDEALVRIHIYLKSYIKRSNEKRSLNLRILDPQGLLAHEEKFELSSLPAYGQETELFLDQFIASPDLWSPDSPSLYLAELICTAPGSASEKITLEFGIRTARFADSLLLINDDSIRPVYPEISWIREFNMSNAGQKFDLLEEANFNTLPLDACISPCLLPLFEQIGILLIRRKSALDPASHRPYMNSPSVIWTE